MMHTATVEASQWWARPRGAESATWIARYQESLGVRHRTAISQIVHALGIKTLLEVGCHCGPNLMRLSEESPALQCWGVDVNAEAIAAGRAWAQSRGVGDRVRLAVGAFPQETESLPSGAYDAVLSCYSLAYVSPPDLDAALYEVGRLSTQAIILAEPMPLAGAVTSDMHNLSGYQEWAHDYQAALLWVGSLRGWTTRIVPIDPPVDRLNAILVVERGSSAIQGSSTP